MVIEIASEPVAAACRHSRMSENQRTAGGRRKTRRARPARGALPVAVSAVAVTVDQRGGICSSAAICSLPSG